MCGRYIVVGKNLFLLNFFLHQIPEKKPGESIFMFLKIWQKSGKKYLGQVGEKCEAISSHFAALLARRVDAKKRSVANQFTANFKRKFPIRRAVGFFSVLKAIVCPKFLTSLK